MNIYSHPRAFQLKILPPILATLIAAGLSSTTVIPFHQQLNIFDVDICIIMPLVHTTRVQYNQ